MRKGILYGLVILLVIVAVSAFMLRSELGEEPSGTEPSVEESSQTDVNKQEDESQEGQEDISKDTEEKDASDEETSDEVISESSSEDVVLSKFDYLPIKDKTLHRATMVSIENTPKARPQSGICKAPIVYEFLVEGGITRFLALYRAEIPDKIGPIRSVRPYMIEIAQEYNALLLHAGASPEGFEILENIDYPNLDQIYNGKYYWRSQQKPTPHNLYTGEYRINDYLDNMLGVEYDNRFNFEEIMIISNAKSKAEKININYWGSYNVIYRYSPEENTYYRYLGNLDNPHFCEDNTQITVKNIIVQFVKTSVKDEAGRLTMELEGSNKALYFRNGVVSEGYWEKEGQNLTKFYNENDEEITVNPGNTWIQIVPTNTKITYEESD
ncbi:MAG: DUF3048 domain-containing protein [Halanaerobiales bacterium]|nr:DUF3048 domain-containing protein [Halanaerobiales bacterium]